MSDLLTYSAEDTVAVLTLTNPPVNAFGPGVGEAIAEGIARAAGDPKIEAIVLIGDRGTFMGGADIREFEKIVAGERPALHLLPFLRAIENAPKPVVAAIGGVALGAGLETAMAAHYRVISPDAKVGQPEVKLGLIPGAAGTQRLPRLAGAAKALDLCVGGESITAAEAVELGIADRLLAGDLRAESVAFAKQLTGQTPVKTSERDEKLRDVPEGLFAAARDRARQKHRGLDAPLAAIDAIEAATLLSFEDGCKRETELFHECLFSNQSRALIHAFFGERTVGKIPGLSKDLSPLEIRRAAVVGAGAMGAGIAMAFANAGIPVILKDSRAEALAGASQRIRANYASTVSKGRLTESEAGRRNALITPQLDYKGFETADIVVEAVFEELSVKKQVFAEIDAVARPGAILATNTSGLDIDEIASATRRPEQVIGNHFFSPANVMRLLEIVRGEATSDTVIASSMTLAKRLGKVAVLARNARGFIGNRMMMRYFREAYFLLEEGASVEQVNGALSDFGMAMGPLAVDDLTGLDVSQAIRKGFEADEAPSTRKPLVPDLLCAQGRFGQKTGNGWSRYDAGRKASASETAAALITEAARQAGIERRVISNEEIVERCIYALVNEGARILGDGIALGAVDIDIVYLAGYGFPAWRGGPLFYADTVGLKQVVARIEELAERHGPELWAVAPLLKQLAESGSSFDEVNRARRG